MKFQAGEILTLNSLRYHILELLGHGAVSDVYLALMNGADDARVVLKVVCADAADDPLKAEALQSEADTLTILNRAEDPEWEALPDALARFHRAQQTVLRRQVITVLDIAELAPGQPCVVQEIAPPAFERFAIESPTDEARMLKIAQAALDVVALAHHHGFSLKDFEPATKGDRFRLQWLDAEQQTFTLKVIDWNITGGPEAMTQDLFYFGGHLYYWLTGRQVYVDSEGRTPANLGMSNPVWETLTAGTRQLVAKLLHRDPKRRYSSVDVLLADLSWWNEVLAQVGASGVFRRLDDRLWQARPAGRYDRVLAIAGLALQLSPPPDARQSFEQSLKQAQEELDKENWQPIAHAQVTLGTRAYEKAVLEFAQQIKILPSESEAARLANIYKLLAGVGGLLKQQYRGMDERTSPEWEALETRAIPALVQRRWLEAQSALAEVARVQPEARNWPTLNDLGTWSSSGVRYTREIEAALKEAENRADVISDAWLQQEREKIIAHQAALAALETVHQQSPFEPEFKERWEIETALLKARKTFYDLYTHADELWRQAKEGLQKAQQFDIARDYVAAERDSESAVQKLKSAQDLFQQILDVDAAQRRAQISVRLLQTALNQAQSLQRQTAALHQAQQDLAAARYDQALAQVHLALQESPGREDALKIQTEASAGKVLLSNVRQYLDLAKTYLDNDEFELAVDQLRSFDGWDGRPLRNLPNGETLPPEVSTHAFRLLPDMRTEASNLRQQIETTRDASQNISRAWEEHDFAEVVSLCEMLQQRYPAMTPQLMERYNEAAARLANRQQAQPKIAQAEDFDDLRKALELLAPDPSANMLRIQAAQQWLRLARDQAQHLLIEDHWQTLLTRLSEGQRLFPADADTFKGMHALLKRAHDLALLPISLAAETPPAWLVEKPDWLMHLTRVEEEIAAVLAESQSWPQLQQLVTPWRARLHQHLEVFLQTKFDILEEQYPHKDVLLHEIWTLWGDLPILARNGLPPSLLERNLQKQFGELHALALKREFTAARAGIEALWSGFPEATRKDPPEGLATDVRDFRTQLDMRLKADEVFKTTLQRLRKDDPPYSFQDAAANVRGVPLPEHPDIPTTDLETLRSELEHAAPIEKLASLFPVPDLHPSPGKFNYAQLIRQCREEAPALATLTEIPVLGERVDHLRTLLPSKRDALGKALEQALTQAVEQLQKQPETDPQPLLDLYHQTRWHRSMDLYAMPSAAMHKAHKLPRLILEKTAGILAKAQSRADFANAKHLLQQAETVNNGVLSYPGMSLPPLPEKVSLVDIGQDWQLDAGTMTQLRNAFADLDKHLQTAEALSGLPASFTQDVTLAAKASYYAEIMNSVKTLALQAAATLKRLEEDWKALGLLAWQPEHTLAQLQSEVSAHQTLADDCIEACHRLENTEVMQGLQSLAEGQPTAEILKETRGALWAKPRQSLVSNYEALREVLIGALSEQIARILAAREATEQLLHQVLLVPKSEELGAAAYDAIRLGVDLRASQALQEGRPDEALRLWKVILDATELWANPDLDAIAFEAAGTRATAKPPKRAKARKQKPADVTSPDENQTASAPPSNAQLEQRPLPASRPSASQSPKKPTMRKR